MTATILTEFEMVPTCPRNLVTTTMVDGDNHPEGYVIKEKSEWTKKEKIEVLKDAKVRNILHNSLDDCYV